MIHRKYDLNKLQAFADENAVSFQANYCESSNELEITITSTAKSECFYMKRVLDVDYLISSWNEHVNKRGPA